MVQTNQNDTCKKVCCKLRSSMQIVPIKSSQLIWDLFDQEWLLHRQIWNSMLLFQTKKARLALLPQTPHSPYHSWIELAF